MSTPLPGGFGIELDADTMQLDESCLFGGSPARVMRLSAAGSSAWTDLLAGPVTSAATGLLARRLTDSGLAHPRPPRERVPIEATIVIPVHDRPGGLDRCLAALGSRHPVLAVDDASADAAAIAAVCARHGVRLVRREVNGGPGAARDTGLREVHTEFVALLDSDCVPAPDWVERLAAHFADPLVGAVAPRIVGVAPHSWAGRYTRANGSLDLGDRPARVAPGTRVSYVPTAALVVRRAALADVLRSGRVFDPTLRVGEDVDLVWRLHEAGWRIRYQPDVAVAHTEPATWPALLRRRFRYGTSAAPLAARHPHAIAPLVVRPGPALVVSAVLARRPWLASTAFAVSVLNLRRTLHRAGVPARGAPRAMLRGVAQTALGVGRYATQFAAPVLVAAAVPARRGQRLAIGALLLAPPVTAWLRRRPDLDLPRYVLGHLADDVAYGAGVWTGAVRDHSLAAVRPSIGKGTRL